MEWLKSTKLVAFTTTMVLSFIGLIVKDGLSGNEFQMIAIGCTTALLAAKIGQYKYENKNKVGE
jgi:hypothetical protein